MEEQKYKKEIFSEVNERRRMDKVYKDLTPSTSIADLKKHSEEFQEINARLKEETRKRFLVRTKTRVERTILSK